MKSVSVLYISMAFFVLTQSGCVLFDDISVVSDEGRDLVESVDMPDDLLDMMSPVLDADGGDSPADLAPQDFGTDSDLLLDDGFDLDAASDLDAAVDLAADMSVPDRYEGRPLLLARKVEASAITVDGSLDDSYDPTLSFTFKDADGRGRPDTDTLSDNIVHVTAAWSTQHLFFFYEVQDQFVTEVAQGRPLWQCDCVEALIDPLRDKGTEFQSDDRQIIINKREGENTLFRRGKLFMTASEAGVEWTSRRTPIGYTVEIAISWEELGVVPSVDTLMGLLLSNSDCDSDEAKDSYLLPWDPDVVAYLKPFQWGAIRLLDAQ